MKRSLLIVLAIATTMAACSNSDSTSTTAPAAPTSTDTFSGTVPNGQGNADFHPFSVAQTGTVSITLVTATPPATIQMGLGVGTPGPGTCSVNSADATITSAGPTAQLSFSLAPGTYCVEVYDVGNQASPVTYSVTVSHP